eukprot:1922853-Prymnesium_polylepis.2
MCYLEAARPVPRGGAAPGVIEELDRILLLLGHRVGFEGGGAGGRWAARGSRAGLRGHAKQGRAG